MTPLQQAAYDIGAKGAEPTEEDRLSFEAWMRGHCWKVEGDWNGRQYVHAHESTGFAHGGAMNTRRLWAAWRDRGALAAQQAAVPADDKARLDWLAQNIFNRENLDLFGKLDKTYNMWVMFSPRGVQGSARAIIDSAMLAAAPQPPQGDEE